VEKLLEKLSPKERAEFTRYTKDWNRNDYTAALNGVFRELPVSMQQFMEDPRYCGGAEDWFPVIKRICYELEQPNIREGFFGLGKGSGKSIAAALTLARGAYELLCFRNWRQVFSQRVGAIYLVNLSTSRPQARGVIFKFFKHLLDSSPWFKGKYKALTEEIRFEKGVMALCGHSGSVAWSGYPIYRGVVDEADLMSGGKGHLKAESLYEMLVTQARPRFPGWYKIAVISVIVEDNGFMMKHINRIRDTGEKLHLPEMVSGYERHLVNDQA